jgi:hypothetical protein
VQNFEEKKFGKPRSGWGIILKWKLERYNGILRT